MGDRTAQERLVMGFAKATQLIPGIYLFGFIWATAVFNWQYAQNNGFWSWVLLGEVVATARATIWPYYAVRSLGSAPESEALDPSVAAFFRSMDSMGRAHELIELWAREGAPEDFEDVVTLMREAERLARLIDPGVLDGLYPEWGSMYTANIPRAMELYVVGYAEILQSEDRPSLARGDAAMVRWNTWYLEHEDDLLRVWRDDLGLDMR